MRCVKEGEDFDGHIRNNQKLGRNILILPGSIKEALIANWMEAHCGFRMTTLMANEHRRQQDNIEVSRYAVMAAFYQLNPKVDVLSKVFSRGNNANWILASYNQCKQMKIMLGELSMDEIMTDDQGKSSIYNHPFQFIYIRTNNNKNR